MSINVKELTKKNMKMSEKDVSDVVSKYMMKIALEQLNWTLNGFYQSLNSVVEYSNNVMKEVCSQSIYGSAKTKNNISYKKVSYNTPKK